MRLILLNIRKKFLFLGLIERALDSDDETEDEIDLSKFMPKTQRKEKIRERKEIPSFAALSDELTKLRIQEFMNPRQNENFHSEVLTPCVDVKKEQRKVVFTRIQRAARLEGKFSDYA